ncbi:hypothetical protein HKD37_15G042813 [Glycine soja]
MHYSDLIAPTGEMCVVSGQCAPDYMDWFFVISHPFMTATKPLDPSRDAPAMKPRHIPQVPEPHIPRVLEATAASTHAYSDEDEPRHAVACHAIAERLERHLNLGIVTLGTETHEVIKQCLRIVRGVTKDHIVYVRSRRRRRTDQP